jgi:LysM repeat protein
MFLNKISSARRVTLGCASLLVLVIAACSMNTRNSDATGSSAAATAAPAASDSDQAATEPQTDTEALGDVESDTGTTTVMVNAGPALKASAPKDYVVKRGDTLWGIANMFLRDPWLWPEIWYVNPNIENPHRIYPGDTVHLALSGNGSTALQIVRGAGLPGSRLSPMLRSQPLENAIPTIPFAAIASFLGRPGVLTRDEVKKAPYILALRGEHDIAGTGDELYVKKLESQNTGTRYAVMHVDEELKDPEGDRKLGYLAIYAGTAQLVRPGSVAKATLTDSAREVLQGDLLVSEDTMTTADFRPHVPSKPVTGEVIAVVAGEDLAGQYDVVALNRGSADGLERGNVLSVDQDVTPDPCTRLYRTATCQISPHLALPAEMVGTLLVFKTYPQMSYALVLHDTVPILMDDRFRNP